MPGRKARAYLSLPNWLDCWVAKTASSCAWIFASPMDGWKTRTFGPRPASLPWPCVCATDEGDDAKTEPAEMPPAKGTAAATAAPRSTVRRVGTTDTALSLDVVDGAAAGPQPRE